jgi:hypothetical protein
MMMMMMMMINKEEDVGSQDTHTHTSFKIVFSGDRNCEDGGLHGKLQTAPFVR